MSNIDFDVVTVHIQKVTAIVKPAALQLSRMIDTFINDICNRLIANNIICNNSSMTALEFIHKNQLHDDAVLDCYNSKYLLHYMLLFYPLNDTFSDCASKDIEYTHEFNSYLIGFVEAVMQYCNLSAVDFFGFSEFIYYCNRSVHYDSFCVSIARAIEECYMQVK